MTQSLCECDLWFWVFWFLLWLLWCVAGWLFLFIPEITTVDLINTAEKALIRQDEFRKNAVKFGLELWDAPKGQERSEASHEVTS